MLTQEDADGTSYTEPDPRVVALLLRIPEICGPMCPGCVGERADDEGPALVARNRELFSRDEMRELSDVGLPDLLLAHDVRWWRDMRGFEVRPLDAPESEEFRVTYRRRDWGERSGNKVEIVEGRERLIAYLGRLRHPRDGSESSPLSLVRVERRAVGAWSADVPWATERGDLDFELLTPWCADCEGPGKGSPVHDWCCKDPYP